METLHPQDELPQAEVTREEPKPQDIAVHPLRVLDPLRYPDGALKEVVEDSDVLTNPLEEIPGSPTKFLPPHDSTGRPIH